MKTGARMGLGAVALALLGLLFASCAKKSEVDEIVASHLAARGGQEKLQALRSIRETGTVTASDGRVARVVREIKRPDLFRLEFVFQGTTSVFAHDGHQGWQVAPLQGKFEPELVPPEVDTAGGVDQRDLEGPLVNWREKGHVVELAGREVLPSGDAFKLKVTLKGGAIRFDYVDEKTRQVVRSDVPRMVRGRQMILENVFSDFREVGGIVFPHRIETHVKDRPQVLTILVSKVELDPDLDDARFRMPE